MFSCVKYCQTICAILHFHQPQMSFYCSRSYPRFGVVSVSGFHQSYWCVEILISPCCFNLQFFNDKMMLNIFTFYITSIILFLLFHSIFHLYIFFFEMFRSLTQFLIELYILLLLIFKRFCICWTAILYQMCILQDVSPFLGLSANSPDIVFHRA